jgi:hypothetical protein
MSDGCVFCGIVRGSRPADIVWEDDLTMAFIDLRQFHPGHSLVIPREHLYDVRELDYATGAAPLTQPHIAEVMLGHRLPGTWQTYDHYTYLKEQAAAYSAWWKRLAELTRA